jgi:hypothetical protein
MTTDTDEDEVFTMLPTLPDVLTREPLADGPDATAWEAFFTSRKLAPPDWRAWGLFDGGVTGEDALLFGVYALPADAPWPILYCAWTPSGAWRLWPAADVEAAPEPAAAPDPAPTLEPEPEPEPEPQDQEAPMNPFDSDVADDFDVPTTPTTPAVNQPVPADTAATWQSLPCVAGERYIYHVETTMGGGFEQAFGRFTLLVGDSRAGKTMRVRALQHAAAGGASDVQWRTWSKGRALGVIGPDGKEPKSTGFLVAQDGAQRTTARTTSADPNDGVTLLAYETVRDALTGSPDKARAFLAPFLSTTYEEIQARMGAQAVAAFEETAGLLGRASTPLATLLAVRDHADVSMREANKDVKTFTAALTAATADAGPTSAQIEAAGRAADDLSGALRAAREEVNACQQAIQANDHAIELAAAQSRGPQADPALVTRLAELEGRKAALLRDYADKKARTTETERALHAAVEDRDAAAQAATAAEDALADALNRAATAQAALDALPPVPDFAPKVKLLADLAELHTDPKVTSCRLCGSAQEHDAFLRIADKWRDAWALYAARAEAIQAAGVHAGDAKRVAETARDRVALYRDKLATAHRAKAAAEQAHTNAVASVEQIVAAGKATAAEIAAVTAQINTAKTAAPPVEDDARTSAAKARASTLAAKLADAQKHHDAVSNERDRAIQAVARLREQAQAVQGHQGLRDKLEKAQTTAARMKLLKDAAGKAYDECVNAGVSGFVARVNGYLPDGLRFGFRLDPFQWGLAVADGEIHSAPSGAEGIAVLTALCCVVAEQHPDRLVLVVPEERGIDAVLLREIMVKLAETAPRNVQVVLTNIVAPFRGRVAGWEIIKLGKEE